jgi:DMSO/TMAO reductase YedYZ molybdopterin-dependent catalytic subunit
MKTIKKPQTVQVLEKTVTRRSLIEWLGKATVLTLGGELLAACGHNQAVTTGRASLDDSGWGMPTEEASTEAELSFYPGNAEQTVFKKWPERTVDRQELTELLANWTLRVDGLAERPQTFGFADLLALPRKDQVTDFHCVEGWSVLDVPWQGVHLSEIFQRVLPLPSATHLTITSVGDIYVESIPIEVATESNTVLAYGIDGSTIPLAHGFPLRLVVPRLLGYKYAKHIYRIELTDKAVDGYWVKRGYPYDGYVPASRLREGKY